MMETASLILELRNLYPSLTAAEKKMIDCVLEAPDEAIYLSISEMAERSKVSEATIVRLCRKAGLAGYQEFKLRLARDQVIPEENLHQALVGDEDLKTLAQRISEDNAQAVINTTRMVSLPQLERARDALLAAGRIDLIGVGASGYTAMDALYKFRRIGLNASMAGDNHMQMMSASMLKPGDVAMGFSFTGSTRDTVHVMGEAKQAGATTICITNHKKSPITQVSDIVLLTAVSETPLRSGALTSKIAQLHVLDLLYTAMAMQDRERALENIDRTASAVLNQLY